eukprot:jgi/Mesen1/3948/ME000209S02953
MPVASLHVISSVSLRFKLPFKEFQCKRRPLLVIKTSNCLRNLICLSSGPCFVRSSYIEAKPTRASGRSTEPFQAAGAMASPASKPTIDATAAAGLVDELQKVVRSGRTKSLEWRMAQLQACLRMTAENEDAILDALHTDVGKPRIEAWPGEVCAMTDVAKESIKNLHKYVKPQKVSTNLSNYPATSVLVPEPFGVVLILSAWNYPYMLALEPVIGAIAAGNAVVLKPSEMAPATSALLKRLFQQYLDATAIQIVEGGIPETTALLEQRWDKIFYTGSPAVGRIVAAAAAKHLTPVTLELGGKNPTIVDSDTDIEVTAKRIAQGKFYNCGQSCIATDYVLAEASVAPQLVARLKSLLHEWYGPDASQSRDLARVVNARQFKRLDAYLSHPETASAIAYGGQRNPDTLFFEPTILQDVPWDAPLMREEIFGPILPVQSIVGEREKPLALYLFSRNKSLQEEVVAKTSSGAVCVNDTVMQTTNRALPFGGVGESGHGSYHGKFSFDCFSHTKAVMYKGFGGDVDARFPPYTRKKDLFLRALFKGDFLGLILIMLGLRK